MKSNIFLLLCCSFLILLLLPFEAQAEYYLVCPNSNVVYIDGSNHVTRKYQRVTQHKKYHPAKIHHKKRNSYSISVYYVYYEPSPCIDAYGCYCCDALVVPYERSNYEVTYDEPRHFHFVKGRDDDYIGDQATGDDDASIHPGMQIN